MAIEIPNEVAQFLNFIGIKWPQVNEDKVREFATHVRNFATNVNSAHNEATSTIQKIGDSYSGQSYKLLISKWATMSTDHMQTLLTACGVLATALETTAAAIVGMKVAAIGQLVVLAGACVVAQIGAIFTFGLAEAAAFAAVQAARKLVAFLAQQLIAHIIAQVVEAALNPLLGVIQKAVSGMAYSALADMLGVQDGSAGTGFAVNPSAVTTQLGALRNHAQTIAGHADTFSSQIAGLNFA